MLDWSGQTGPLRRLGLLTSPPVSVGLQPAETGAVNHPIHALRTTRQPALGPAPAPGPGRNPRARGCKRSAMTRDCRCGESDAWPDLRHAGGRRSRNRVAVSLEASGQAFEFARVVRDRLQYPRIGYSRHLRRREIGVGFGPNHGLEQHRDRHAQGARQPRHLLHARRVLAAFPAKHGAGGLEAEDAGQLPLAQPGGGPQARQFGAGPGSSCCHGGIVAQPTAC